jgi:hypothetical protein
MKSEHEGTPGWRSGIEAAIRVVRSRQNTLPDLQVAAYQVALSEVETMLQAMLKRGTEARTTPID